MKKAVEWQQDTLFIEVRLQPKSSRNEVIGIKQDQFRIRLTSPPVEGEANKQLCRFIAKSFGVAPSKVTLIRGEKSRDKRLQIIAPKKQPQWLQGKC